MTVQVVPTDTTPDIARMQLEVLRRLPSSKRLEMAFEMSDWMRELMLAGVRSRHPEYDKQQVRLAVTRMLAGEELFRQAFPGVDIEV